MDKPLNVQVIIGSTRPNRYGDKPAHWIFNILKEKAGVEAQLIDLRDWPLPFFDEPVSTSQIKGNYKNPLGKKWAEKIGEADAFIITAAEYNHGYTAVLKNALDWVYPEWNNKPVAFVGYGSVLGGRAIEQLREVSIELQMAPIRNAVHIPSDIYRATVEEKVPPNPELFKPLKEKADGLIEQLLWWGRALRAARGNT
jgi:NAD(P)H-dependent FMN reductase